MCGRVCDITSCLVSDLPLKSLGDCILFNQVFTLLTYYNITMTFDNVRVITTCKKRRNVTLSYITSRLVSNLLLKSLGCYILLYLTYILYNDITMTVCMGVIRTCQEVTLYFATQHFGWFQISP